MIEHEYEMISWFPGLNTEIAITNYDFCGIVEVLQGDSGWLLLLTSPPEALCPPVDHKQQYPI